MLRRRKILRVQKRIQKDNIQTPKKDNQIGVNETSSVSEKPMEENQSEEEEVEVVFNQTTTYEPLKFPEAVESIMEELGDEVLDPPNGMSAEHWLSLLGLGNVTTRGDGHCQFRAVHGSICQSQQTTQNSKQFNQSTKNLEKIVSKEFFKNINEELSILKLPYVVNYLKNQEKNFEKYPETIRTITKDFFVQLSDAPIEQPLHKDWWGGMDTLRILAKAIKRNIYAVSHTWEHGVEMRMYGECKGKKNKNKTYIGVWNDGNLRDVIGKLIQERISSEYAPIVILYDAKAQHYESTIWRNDIIGSRALSPKKSLFQPKIKDFFIEKVKSKELYVDSTSEDEDPLSSSQESVESNYSDEDNKVEPQLTTDRVTRQQRVSAMITTASEAPNVAIPKTKTSTSSKKEVEAEVNEKAKKEIENTFKWLKNHTVYKQHFSAKVITYAALNTYSNWIKQDKFRLRFLLQNIDSRFLVARKITLEHMAVWGQKLWEANQINMLTKVIKEKRLDGENQKIIE